MGEEILDQRCAELTLHEGVAGDLASPPRQIAALRKDEKQLHERCRKRVFSFADVGILGPIDLVECLVFDGDIGRVTDDDVVPTFLQQSEQEGAVLGRVGERHERRPDRHAGQHAGIRPVDQRVTHGQVEGEGGGLFQRAQAAGLERGEGEPEPGDRDRERV